MLYNLMMRQDFRHSHEKLVWILLLLITPVFGMMLYFIKSNPRRRRRGFNPDFSKN
ncbi:PLD nuclease N-terminal domain-containing protein [Algoriphagus halophytocola]|uniref:PLD nuclease N-terminal domain-containing protein n=1 Tax=Algoriphagus halophytocola TaxID=2991499 RepID=UPI0037BEA8B8